MATTHRDVNAATNTLSCISDDPDGHTGRTRHGILEAHMSIIGFLVVGLIAGFIARALVPGPDTMGIIPTLILGVVGSFVGGLILAIFTDDKILSPNPTGIIGSIIGAIVALLLWRKFGPKAKSTEPQTTAGS